MSFPPKLINKHCCFSISRPSCCQRMKSRKNLNFSLSVILFWENLCEIKLWWERSSSKIENRYLNLLSIIYWRSGSSANIDIELDLQARIGCSLFAKYKNRNNVDVMSVSSILWNYEWKCPTLVVFLASEWSSRHHWEKKNIYQDTLTFWHCNK